MIQTLEVSHAAWSIKSKDSESSQGDLGETAAQHDATCIML